MSQENEIRIKLTPRTPTEVLYQQTVDDLRKTIAELQEQLVQSITLMDASVVGKAHAEHRVAAIKTESDGRAEKIREMVPGYMKYWAPLDAVRVICSEHDELRIQLQKERVLADALAVALKKQAIRLCQLCSDYTGPGAYLNIYENIPKTGSDGRFYHARHDKLDGGDWLCSAQDMQAALAQHTALRSGTATTLSEPTGTDDDLIPRATVDAMREHLESK